MDHESLFDSTEETQIGTHTDIIMNLCPEQRRLLPQSIAENLPAWIFTRDILKHFSYSTDFNVELPFCRLHIV